MSWVQQKQSSAITLPPSSSSSSSNNTSSSLSLLFNSNSSLNPNTTFNQTSRNVNSLRQACQPVNNATQQIPHSLLMTSQYSNTVKTSIKSPTPTKMRINPSTPYQNIPQQQLHQQQQQLNLSQRHQQHQPNNAFPQSTSQVPTQTGITNLNVSNTQAVFSTQQQNSWPNQTADYLPLTKGMQPTPPQPAAVSAATVQKSLQTINMYQPNAAVQQQQQWPQNSQQTSSSENYYQPHQQQQPNANNNTYQQQLPTALAQQQVAQQHSYIQQQPLLPPQTMQHQTNSVNFFDQQAATADGWSDWDWNDNSNISTHPTVDQAAQIKTETNSQTAVQQPKNINQQLQNPNNFLLTDSFNTQISSNDSWNWGSKESNQQQGANQETQNLDNNNSTQNNNWNWNNQANDKENRHQQFPAHMPPVNDQHMDNWNWHSTNDDPQQVTAVQESFEMNTTTTKHKNQNQIEASPPPPPPTEFSSSTAENHNYNTSTIPNTATATAVTATPPNNIPNTVFVTQAKPVTLPSRQYASPPSGNTPITENPPEMALIPPQGFQNSEELYQNPLSVITPPLPSLTVGTNAMAIAPPPAITILQPATNKNSNPFKRSGVAQHHRASGLMPNATAAAQPPESGVFNIPPPPPADFANPGMVTLMEPDNNELPSQENQEVLTLPTTQITLPNATIQPPAVISLPNSAVTQAPPPPNDERNQYLQTSHLSENPEEQQPEIDGLLPPPGLSRLVLGQPELEASQQRMVMGTEASNVDNAVTQAAVMHLEERHADGEDTASENALPVTSSVGQAVASTSSNLSSDRNLYMVPGESNTDNSNQQQRVVTGVELAEQREIEMDGENLEDEQIQQHQQVQHPHSTLSAEARNEPPVEGADDYVVIPPVTLINTNHTTDQHLDQQHQLHSTNQLSNVISSPNDDDDSDERLLNDRGMTQSNAGSSKSRAKYENERLAVASRRRDKRSSVERYESDEYLNSDGEYSSEREERERRERDRRRNYREGSVRSERGVNDEDDKRSRRQRSANKRDKYYYEGEERSKGERDERERERGTERSKIERRSQRQRGYDADSRYETEESTRFDTRKDTLRRSIRRNDADYEEFNRRGGTYRSAKRTGDNYESDRRDRRRSDKHREPRYREDPRYDPREYEEYRKHSSRNARESDMEKEGAARSGRMHHDTRHAAAMYGYPSGGYYDPYTAYYYQQMARNNPQAYAEWYKKYYGQTAAAGVSQSGNLQVSANTGQADTTLPATTNDGRESVHSGRSSVHNEVKDRYTHAYITQANDYHRHYQQQQHLHLQHFHQQQQQQQQMSFNQNLNSTILDEDNLNHNSSIYSGLGNLSLNRSNTNLSQIHGGYYMNTTGSTAAGGVYYARSDYAESRSGALSQREADAIAQEPQRLTPCKFITEHAVVNFASGILVTVKPKYTSSGSISNIVKLLKFKPNDETRKLFKVFPGPLVRGLTHKKTVIEFCQEQIRLGPIETTIYAKQLITNNAEKYRGSYTLMWNLLILLLKQNGMVVGTDIAELLLKNQQEFPFQTPVSTTNNSLKSKSGSNSPTEDLDLAKEDSEELTEKQPNLEPEKSPQEEELSEDNSLTKSSSNTGSLTEDEVTEKFRNYLLYGNVNEALEWATDNNLWGHALFLASKLDRRSHANVMMKFANKLSLNDPLQTLYQLMSGRTPSSVTCVQDEKWGDWRPHLSMILSNTSQKPDLDRKAITSLGDSLFNRGDLYAAHFCYLMAQVGFGRYQETATEETSMQQHLPKLVLLGSSHYKQFKNFAHNESIIMTEIYEYACSLNDDKFSIVEFQPYKFLLATRLLDYGFHLKSLMYLEQTAVHITRDPSKYESSFINKVYEMADRLKYHDPVLEKTIDDQQPISDDNSGLSSTQQQVEEQEWLQHLRQLAQNYKINFNVSSSLAMPTTVLQENSYYNQEQQQQQQQIDQQFMEINKQFSELNLQYQQQTPGNNEQQEQQQPMFYNNEQQQQLQVQPAIDLYQQQQQQQQQEPSQSLQTELPKQSANDLQQQQHQIMDSTQLQQDAYQQQQSHYLQTDMTHQPASLGYNSSYYDPMQYNAAEADHETNANYDYWQQQQQQQQESLAPLADGNTRPTISMPKSKTYDTDDETSAKAQQHHSNTETHKKQQQVQQQQQQKGAKKEDKNQQQSNQNSGWFGGIWNKFSLKPKNQMILPDDKNPSIVWDPEKKKWVNTDGDEDEQEAFKPPPKMSDLIPQQQQQQQPQHILPQDPQLQTHQIPFMDPQQLQQQQIHQQPQLQQFVTADAVTQSAPSPNPAQQQQNLIQTQTQAPIPAKTPTLQSNKFKMQRNRTLKNAYVDVFNPSGAPVNKAAENILAPALPPAAIPQSGFFIPGSQSSVASGTGGSTNQEQLYQQQPQQQDTLQFYNPNQFTGTSGY